MIRQVFIYTVSLFLLAHSASAQKPITLNDIWASGVFYPKMISGFINLNDGKSYCKKEKDADGNTQVVRYLYATGERTGVLIDGSKIAAANGMQYFAFGSFTLNADETKALIPVNTESIYRHSSRSNYLIWDKATNKLRKVSEEKVRYATFNPQSTKVAYVFNNDLYVKDLAKNKTKRLTKDGQHNSIINGAVDWVYEEEFGMSRGYEWNADGTKIAYYKFDESRVKEWDMEVYGNLYPNHTKFKYPKAGEANSVVDVYITNLKNKGKKA